MIAKLPMNILCTIACILLLGLPQGFSADRPAGHDISFNAEYPTNEDLFADRVSGKVTNEEGKPMTGVSVNVTGTSISTITDNNGLFSIQVDRGQTIEFSYVDHTSQSILYSGQTSIDVQLKITATDLNQVVVIGYGTVKKKDLMGAVSVINKESLQNRSSSDVGAAIRGLAAGVKVTSAGLAGQPSVISIRGIGNLTNNDPLMVIDGLPTYGGFTLNVNDIASVQILKDASSAAIYGSRAANGVIIITTKQGQQGPLKVNFSSQVSSNWLPKYNLLNTQEYISYNDQAYDEAIRVGIATKRQDHQSGNTDWQNEVLKTGLKQNYDISLSGGNSAGKFFVSMNKLADAGTLYKTNYDRYSFRVNSSGKKGAFSYGENLYIMKWKQDGMVDNPFANIIAMPPTIPVFNEANQPGGYGFGTPEGANTYALNAIAQQDIMTNVSTQTLIKGNVYGEVRLFKDLAIKLNLGYTHGSLVNDILRKRGTWTMGQAQDNPYITKSNTSSEMLLAENTYSYSKKLGRHSIEAIAGISVQTDNSEDLWATKLLPLQVGDQYYESLNSASGTTTAGGNYQESVLISNFGRVNYSFDDRYLLGFTFRRDGTSRLPEDTRWGHFPSVSGAWRISKEKFFQSGIINDLKIRASYGILGNANIGNWDYIAAMNNAPRAVLGTPEQVIVGITQSRLVNTDIVWEKKIQTNIGADIAMLNNRLTASAEYFISTSKDLLVALPILLTTGNNGGNPIVNAASLENRGIEFNLGWRDRVGEISYGINANFSRIRNKVLDLGYGRSVFYSYLSKSEIGSPLASFYLFKKLGIFQSADEIANYKNKDGKVIQPNALPGDIKYGDYNGDGQISSDDRQITGNPWPKFEAGLSMNMEWKGFDLLVQGHGRFGQDVWNGARATAGDFANNNNNFKDISPWSPTNKSTDQPRIVFGDTRNSRGDQDRWLESGSFFRISEIGLGYNLPKRLCDKIGLDQLRVGTTLMNMITFTKYSGLDPDFIDGGILQLGADGTSYPNARSILFSLNVGF